MHIQKLIDYHNAQAEFFESFGVKNEVAVFHRKALALLMDGVAENKRLRQELKNSNENQSFPCYHLLYHLTGSGLSQSVTSFSTLTDRPIA